MRRLSLSLATWMVLTVAVAQMPDSPTGRVAEAGSPGSEDALVSQFFAAFNTGDAERMQAFYAGSATEDFRSRRSDEEDRELYAMLYGDMGPLEVQGVTVDAPGEVQVTARSERIPDPVRFVFSLKEGKIDGFIVNVGGPGEDEGGAPALDLPRGADDSTLSRALDRQLERLAAEGAFSGVVLLARNGRPFFHEAYGLAHRPSGRPNAKDTRFDVGSITKLMTKIAVAQLAQAGRLSLDDSMLKWLPDYPDSQAAAKITVRHLVDHRSGLGDVFNERWEAAPKEKLIAPEDFFPLFAGRPLHFEPGTGKAYSNAGYIVLGAIVEAASGRPYAAYVEEHVFRPAGMLRSGFPLRDGKSPELAVGYTRHGAEGDDEVRSNLGLLPVRGCPAGSSVHSAEDLLKLDRALRAGRLLDPQWTAWVFTGSKTAGAGGRRSTFPLGVAGGGPGVNAGLESDGASTAIVLANLDPPIAEDLALQLFRALH